MGTILITGINGYLGSNLANIFSAEYNIVGLEYSLDNFHRIEGKEYKLYSIKNGIPENLFKENEIDVIIHTATFYGRQNEDVKKIANANLFSPFELLDIAILYKCKIFINTDTVLDRFVSTYALTKRHFQEWLYLRCNEIKVINIQLEHFYGPGCANTNFIISMIEKLKDNVPSIELTQGEQRRDFLYIEDLLEAYKLIVSLANSIPEKYSSFQVASGELISIRDVLEYLHKITNSNTKLIFGAIPYRENELMLSETNISALVRLGWKPKFTIREGLQLTALGIIK